jgi:O-methyltransferase
MKRIIIKINGFMKGIILFSRPHLFFGWLRKASLKFTNLLSLSKWISVQDKKDILNDFYSPGRDYSKRYQLYQYVVDKLFLMNEAIDYLEFGVSGGHSFRWWQNHCNNPESKFYGFDTFEGLPEKWGTYHKGDMAADIPVTDDKRVEFIKGLFQDTVPGFLSRVNLNNGKRKIVHMDADLFSSTLYALTNLADYLKRGDIIMFDEFNVPDHEYLAFKMFSDAFYIRTKLFAAVNNYFQVALVIE